jgi:hypothetical protein
MVVKKLARNHRRSKRFTTSSIRQYHLVRQRITGTEIGYFLTRCHEARLSTFPVFSTISSVVQGYEYPRNALVRQSAGPNPGEIGAPGGTGWAATGTASWRQNGVETQRGRDYDELVDGFSVVNGKKFHRRGGRMSFRRIGQVLTSLTLLIGLSASVGLTRALAASPRPTVVVSPSGSLKNGQVVKVSGHGFKPGDSVFIIECLTTSKNSTGCDVATATPVTITAKGLLPPTKFKVVTGVVGSGACGTTKGNLKNCALDVGNMAGTDAGTARIIFLAPPPKK